MAAPWRLFYWANLTKIIEIADEDSDLDGFTEFCEEHDIAVMDRLELFEIYKRSGPGYALRRWYQMQAECGF